MRVPFAIDNSRIIERLIELSNVIGEVPQAVHGSKSRLLGHDDWELGSLPIDGTGINLRDSVITPEEDCWPLL